MEIRLACIHDADGISQCIRLASSSSSSTTSTSTLKEAISNKGQDIGRNDIAGSVRQQDKQDGRGDKNDTEFHFDVDDGTNKKCSKHNTQSTSPKKRSSDDVISIEDQLYWNERSSPESIKSLIYQSTTGSRSECQNVSKTMTSSTIASPSTPLMTIERTTNDCSESRHVDSYNDNNDNIILCVVAVIRKIEEESYNDNHHHHHFEDKKKLCDKIWQQNNNEKIIASDNEIVVGFLSLKQRRRKNYINQQQQQQQQEEINEQDKKTHLHLSLLFVHPSYQKQGIATKLWKYVMDPDRLHLLLLPQQEQRKKETAQQSSAGKDDTTTVINTPAITSTINDDIIVTVNSSQSAIGFYKTLGFRTTTSESSSKSSSDDDGPFWRRGKYLTPMVLILPRRE